MQRSEKIRAGGGKKYAASASLPLSLCPLERKEGKDLIYTHAVRGANTI